ncbi:MAG TPA: M15 family metallopeptidase [Acidimicrobiia bacterium]|nr:M15 family metallopeptidase [Acidimicrobiia bacterium]
MRRVWPLTGVVLIVACAASGADVSSSSTTTSTVTTSTMVPTTTTTTMATTTSTATTTTLDPFARPDWLGTRPLPLRPDGHGEVQPTPPELQDRRLATIDLLPPPEHDVYASSIAPIPPDVLARSSWQEGCPVGVDQLRYLTMVHWGFDGKTHTGEMIVNADFAEEMTQVFARLFEAGYPIEQMRVIRLEEIDADPTGDGNDTTSFVCRPAVGSGSWSYHAYGLAIDVNPFHNPYLKDDLVLPELATAYTDRETVRAGMILGGDVVTEAFADIGWSWGGDWNTLKDWMHFSSSGR